MSLKTTHTTESAVSFGVSSRLVAILGQHLIRDNTVGLMELIKNGYDADADHVTVEMYDLADSERSLIIVEDNGAGMTRQILTGPWLTVAHGHKEEAKSHHVRSGRGRMPLGEKGVGRFAVHKLGRRLRLITRPAGQETELLLEIDWDEFESHGGAIGQVPLKLTERAPRHFVGPNGHGTRLEMAGARDRWQRRDVAKLQASLMRLTSPRFGVANFKVTLRCPEFPEFESIEAAEITQKYQFQLDCEIDETGMCYYEYRWRDNALNEHEQSGATQLWQEQGRRPACGPFRLNLTSWLLNQQRFLAEVGVTKDQIHALSGISIYRDGFRILPYGDEGDDWLNLDARRVNNPSVRFGNKQMIGLVAIDQVHNRALADKTNREGLQENAAYEDLKRMVLSAVNTIEQLSLKERQQKHRTEVERKQQLAEETKRLDRQMEQIAARAFQAPNPAPVKVGTAPAHQPIQSEVESRAQVTLNIEELRELQRTAKAVTEQATQVAGMREEERDVYLQLLGTGLAAERFIHEVDRQLGLAVQAVGTLGLAGLEGRAGDAVRQLDLFINSLRNELRLFGQLRYVQRSQRSQRISVREITEFLLLARDPELSGAGIKLDPWMEEDLTVLMSEAAVAQVIGNVLDNAIYWLGQSTTGVPKLRVDLDPEERTLVIANNGPVVDPVVADKLFERPFVTTKEEGHGLGLYLSQEIMKRAGGALAMLPEEQAPLEGPAFVIRFPKPD